MNPHKPYGDMEELLVFSLETDTFYKQIGQTSSKVVAAQHSEHHAGIHHFKPIALYDKLLAMLVPDGGRVCDITMYTGISAVASSQRGLHYVGIELNPDYIDRTKQRLLESAMLPECDVHETDAVDPDADADDRLPDDFLRVFQF